MMETTGPTPANCSRPMQHLLAGKVWSPMVGRTVCGTTSADVVEEHSRRRALMCDMR